MKPQLLALLELKKVDEKAHRLSTEMERLPQTIQNLQNKLNENRESLDKSQVDLDATEKKQRQVETDLKEKSEMLEKAESKLMQITNTDEMTAAEKEVKNQKKEKTALEEEHASVSKKVTELKAATAKLKEDFTNFSSSIQEDLTRLTEEKNKLEVLLGEQLQKQEAAVKNLDKSTANIYQRVVAKKKGLAIVTVDNGRCIGCNMRVRPQIYNEILSMRYIHSCSNCSRILLPPTLENEIAKGV